MIVFVWFCMKYIWPVIMGAIEQRQTEIANGSRPRSKGQSSLTHGQGRGRQDHRGRSRPGARHRRPGAARARTASSSRRRPTAKPRARAQLEAARAEIDVEINRAREELRGQVAKIAVAGAEKVLGREIDANAHRDLLGKLASEL